MSNITFALPLCDDQITIADDNYTEWFQCRCGRFYKRETLLAYKQALDALYAADERAERIEQHATKEDIGHRVELQGVGAPAAAAATSASSADDHEAMIEYIKAQPVASAAWSADSTTAASTTAAGVDFNKAPVKVAALRPRRQLPKLTPQQTLLTVAASLLLIALSIFFGTTWNEPWFSLPLKAAVLAVIVAATAFGAIRSKKYFVIISNFLAALSSGFLALGLYAAAALGLFGDKSIASPTVSPYLAFVVLVTGVYSTLMGRRFKVFGWLAVTPISVAVSGLLSVEYFQNNQLWPNFDATILSLTALLTYVAGKLTRLPAPVAIEAPKKSKKAEAVEDSEEVKENKYQLDLFGREQNALNNVIRVSAALSMAVLALKIFTSLPLAVLNPTSMVSSVGFFILALVWLSASVGIELRGANFIVSDEVPRWAKVVSWNLGFGLLAGALLLALRPQQPQISWLITMADALVGAALLFVVNSKIAAKFEASLLASQIAAGVVWGLYIIPAGVERELDSTLFASWLSVVAAALFAKAWLNKQRLFALLAAVAGNVAAVSLVILQTSDNTGVLGSLAAALILCSVWFVAIRVLDSRLQIEKGFGALIYFVANAVLALGVLIRWNALAGDWSLLAVVAILSAVMVWLSHSKLSRGNERNPLVGNAIVWAISGFVVLLEPAFGSNLVIFTAYSAAIFAIALFDLSKSKSQASAIGGVTVATILTVIAGRYSLDATAPSHLVNPASFLILTIVTSLLVHRVGKTSSRQFNLVAAVGFVITWAAFMVFKLQFAATWSASDASNNSIYTVVAFGLFASALLLLRLREPVKKNLSTYFGVAGVTSLLGSLLAASSVSATETSLLLITATLLLSFALSYITARALKSSRWFWAAYALALSSVASTQATILAGQTGSVFDTWMHLIVPISLALTLVLHMVMTTASKAAETKLGWQVLPAVSVGAALLAYLTPVFAGYYTTNPLVVAAGSEWTTVIGFVALAAVYLGLRLRGKSSPESARALLSTSAISLALALVSIVGAGELDLQLQLATILGFYSLLLLAQAAIKLEVRTNFYGSALLLASGWLFINKLTENASFALVEFYSLSGAAVFLLSIALVKRADSSYTTAALRYALPLVFAAGTAIGLVQYQNLSFSQTWVQFFLADTIAVAALFASRIKFNTDAPQRRNSLWVVGGVSWIVALLQATSKVGSDGYTSNSQLLRELILALSVAATALVIARLDKQKLFLALGFVTSATAGALAGTYTLLYVSFAGPELFWSFIALGLFVSVLVSRQIEAIEQRFATLATIALPLLTVAVPSVIYSWATIAQPISSLEPGQLTRVLALAIGGGILVVLGVRMGNLGLTVAGAAPLSLTLVPNIWFRIDDAFSGRAQFEIKALFIGVLLYGAMRAIFAALNTSLKSIVYIGIPVVIAIGPAMIDALSALSQPSLTREDWLRFFIVLGGSLVLLVLGSLRKIGGLFVPGAVGVVISALPYAWAQISSQNWALWFVLILVATLLVMVAIRLEQFKTGAKSASNWMRELR